MPRLKIILQSKVFISISLIFLILYCVVFTKINDSQINGMIISYKIDGDKLSISLKSKEKIEVSYYISNEEEKEFLKNNLKLGLTVDLKGQIKEPSNNTIPNTFNYK